MAMKLKELSLCISTFFIMSDTYLIQALPQPNVLFIRRECFNELQTKILAISSLTANGLQSTNNLMAQHFDSQKDVDGHQNNILTQIGNYAFTYNGVVTCKGEGGKRESMATSEQCLQCLNYVASELLIHCPWHLFASMSVVDCSAAYSIEFKELDSCPLEPDI